MYGTLCVYKTPIPHVATTRNVRVNEVVVHPGAHTPLPHLSLVSIVNVHLLFTVNTHSTTRLKERSHKLLQML